MTNATAIVNNENATTNNGNWPPPAGLILATGTLRATGGANGGRSSMAVACVGVTSGMGV
jgi:hypothetical protein